MSTSLVKWSEGLRKRVFIIHRRYTDHMIFYLFICFYCVSLYMWLYILYASIFLYYVFLFLCLCILIVMYVQF